MERQNNGRYPGVYWTAAIVALAVLLALGVFLYLRMSTPLSEPARPAFAPVRICEGASGDINGSCRQNSHSGDREGDHQVRPI